MNESTVTAIATSNVIMMEIMVYAVASIIIVALLDFYAVKKIGDKRRPAYQALKAHKAVSFFDHRRFHCGDWNPVYLQGSQREPLHSDLFWVALLHRLGLLHGEGISQSTV